MEIVKYNVNQAAIAQMSDIYLELTIKDIEDVEGLTAVRSARMTCVRHRTAIDKLRKTTNADAQTFIKTNNANAKKLTDALAPIELHLKTQEEIVTKEKERLRLEEERIERELIQSRVDALLNVGIVVSFEAVAMMDESDYIPILTEATEKLEAEKLRKEQEEADRKAETGRLEKIATEQEAVAKAQAERKAELEALEKEVKDAKRKMLEAEERKTFEAQAKIEAKIKAEKDAKEKLEREEKATADKILAEEAEKKRLEEITPDKIKLVDFANSLYENQRPVLSYVWARKILSDVEDKITEISDFVLKETKKL